MTKPVALSSREAEQSVLGGMLVDPAGLEKALGAVAAEMFHEERHRRVFEMLADLYRVGVPADTVTVAERMQARGDLDKVGGIPYLAHLVESSPTAANIEYHCRIVREKYTRRRLVAIAAEVVQEAQRDQPMPELLDAVESRVMAVTQVQRGGGHVRVSSLLRDAMDQIERQSQSASAVTGLASGWRDLDEMTAGFQKGELIIVAARPSMGKSAIVGGIAQHAGIALNVPVAFFSLEMSKESLVTRMIASEARVDSNRIRTGRLRDDDFPRLLTACGLLNSAPIYIDDEAGLSVLEVRARSRKIKAQHPELGLIIVDYLQLMTGGTKTENRQQEVSEISRGLKALAKELGVPVVALSQLSRAVEQRAEKRPMMSDLRESGALEQDADVIMFLYRPEYYEGTTDKAGNSLEGRAEVIIGKNRNGATGTVHLVFLKEFTRFDSVGPKLYREAS